MEIGNAIIYYKYITNNNLFYFYFYSIMSNTPFSTETNQLGGFLYVQRVKKPETVRLFQARLLVFDIANIIIKVVR